MEYLWTKAFFITCLLSCTFIWALCDDILQDEQCLSFPINLKGFEGLSQIKEILTSLGLLEKAKLFVKAISYFAVVAWAGTFWLVAEEVLKYFSIGRVLKAVFLVFAVFCLAVWMVCDKVGLDLNCPSRVFEALVSEELEQIVSEGVKEVIQELEMDSGLVEICACLGLVFGTSLGIWVVKKTVSSQIKYLIYLIISLAVIGSYSYFDLFQVYREYRVYIIS